MKYGNKIPILDVMVAIEGNDLFTQLQTKTDMAGNNEINIAKKVRQKCIKAAKESFRDASMRGLCSDGAIEAAIGAIQSLDVEKIVDEAKQINR